MRNYRNWVELATGISYASIQSLFWFYAVLFVIRRMGATPLPDTAILIVMVTAWILILPLSILTTVQRNIWMVVTMFTGVGAGYYYYGDLLTFLIIIFGMSWFSLRRINDGISSREFVNFLMGTIIFFGFAFAFSFFIDIDDAEVWQYIFFFSVTFVLTIIGVLLSQLTQSDSFHNDRFTLKQWGLFSGYAWVVLGVLSLGSIGILLILLAFIPFANWLLNAILVPIGAFIGYILPWLQDLYREAMNEAAPEYEVEVSVEDSFTEQFKDVEANSVASMIIDIILYVGLALLVIWVVYRIIKEVRKRITKQLEVKNGSAIVVEKSDAVLEEQPSWWKKLLNTFRGYSDGEHLVRKEYRQLLKVLRKKGLLEHNTMTVNQLNQMIRELQRTSSLYERVRYGDQELSAEELSIYQAEMKTLIDEMAKKEK